MAKFDCKCLLIFYLFYPLFLLATLKKLHKFTPGFTYSPDSVFNLNTGSYRLGNMLLYLMVPRNMDN